MADERVAVITGASGALGRALVAEFVSRGTVVGVVRSEDDVRGLESAHPGSVRGVAADLTDPGQVEELWERIDGLAGTPDSLVNAAGGFRSGSVIETGQGDYRFMQDLNLGTVWLAARAAASRMRESGRGSIVNVSARTGLVGGAGSAAYALAKSGVIKLTQVLAEELKDDGIRVNAVLPALIDTPANRGSYPPERMHRAVSPEAIARVIAFLCGDDAWPITGATIPVYGRY